MIATTGTISREECNPRFCGADTVKIVGLPKCKCGNKPTVTLWLHDPLAKHGIAYNALICQMAPSDALVLVDHLTNAIFTALTGQLLECDCPSKSA